MLQGLQTVQTQAMQLWLKPTLDRLGWKEGSTILTAYAHPFETWADMSQVLDREPWPADLAPGNLAYFCGPLQDLGEVPPPTDHGFPARQNQLVKDNAIRWLSSYAGHLWPGAAPLSNPAGLAWDFLVDPKQQTGVARFDAQYWRANSDASARYVLSLPGTTALRLRAGESGFDNLFLAGDWVRNGLNFGCVESAVMGGLQAARAICGYPEVIPGETDITEVRSPSSDNRRTLFLEAGSEDKAPYVESGGELALPQPYAIEGVQMYAFVLAADPQRLAQLIDEQLNQPTGWQFHFRPFTFAGLGPVVILSFHRIASNHSVPPARNIGWMPTVETAFFVPIQRGTGAFALPSLWTPYIIVSHPWAMVSGREVYGVPKGLGSFEFPKPGEAPSRFGVDTATLKRLDPSSQVEVARLVEVIAASATFSWSSILADFEAALGNVALLGPALLSRGTLLDMWHGFWRLSPTLVYLKQFRDATDFQRACYQALIEVPTRPLSLPSLRFLFGKFVVKVYPFESHPIVQDLGLATTPPADGPWELDVLAALECEFGFEMENGRELWHTPHK